MALFDSPGVLHVPSDTLTMDETTHLLAKPSNSEEWDGSTTGSEPTRKKFALWQMGAFVGILLAYSDTSLVWATHETVSSHFNNLENSSWIMTIFAICYSVTLPLYARLSDNYGRLRPLVASYFTFCIGCTICGLCQTYWQMLLGRALTGCGASGVVSLASIIVTDIAEPSEVAVLRSYLNVATTIGLSAGGPLGGFLGGTVGWRWSFLGQVPIAICCCSVIARALQTMNPTADEEDAGSPEQIENELDPSSPSFDYLGAITLAIGISSLLSVIDLQHRYSWVHPLVLSLTIVGASSIVAFVLLETYPGNRELLVPMSLLKTEIGAFCAGQVLIVGSCHGFISQVAPYFSNTQGASDASAGLKTIPSSVGNALGNLIAGQVIKKFGSYRKLSLISLSICIVSAVSILFQWSHRLTSFEALTIFPFGLFAGMVLSTQFFGLYICAPKEHMATSISMYYMSQQIGIALGISICSSVWKRQVQERLLTVLVDVPGYKEIIKKLMIDSAAVELLPEGVRSLVAQSYLHSFWVVPALVIGAQVFALIPMLSETEQELS